jgi:hypothetical protein
MRILPSSGWRGSRGGLSGRQQATIYAHEKTGQDLRMLVLPGSMLGLSMGEAGCSLGFSYASAVLFGRFFVVCVSFHVSDETFFFAQLFESSHHLLHGFAGTRFNLQHGKQQLLS